MAARRCRPNEVPAGAIRGHFHAPPQVSAGPTRCLLLVDCYVVFFWPFPWPRSAGRQSKAARRRSPAPNNLRRPFRSSLPPTALPDGYFQWPTLTGSHGGVRTRSNRQLGAPGGPGSTDCEFAISHLSPENGTAQSVPGPMRLHSTKMVSREVVLMSCGLGRTRRRRAATMESATIAEGCTFGWVGNANATINRKCDHCAAELQIPPSTSQLWLVQGGF